LPDQLAILREYRTELLKQYALALRDVLGAPYGLDRSKLQQRADEIDVQIQGTDATIKELEQQGRSPLHAAKPADSQERHSRFEKTFPYIDFEKPVERVWQLHERWGNRTGAAVLVLQNGNSMAGIRCMQRLRYRFQEETSIRFHVPEPHTVLFNHSRSADPLAILSALGRRLELTIDAPSGPGDYGSLVQLVVDALVQSMQTRSVVFIELHYWDYVASQSPDFLIWFLTCFWQPLLNALNRASSELPYARVFAVLHSDNPLSDVALPAELCCADKTWSNGRGFDSNKVVVLPLKKWKQEQVLNWLERQWGLKAPDSTDLADRFYKFTNGGVPLEIENKMRNHFCSL